MTFTRDKKMLQKYVAGKLNGMGPINAIPTRLRLVFQPSQVSKRHNIYLPCEVLAIVCE